MGNLHCVCCRGQAHGEERSATVVLDANDEDRWRPEYIYVTVLRAAGLTSGQDLRLGPGLPPDPFCMVRLKGGMTGMVRTQTVVSTREPDWGDSARTFSFRRAFNHNHVQSDATRAEALARAAEGVLRSGDLGTALQRRCVANVRLYDEDIPSTGLMYFDVCLGGVDVDVTDLAPGETIKGWFPLTPKGSRRDRKMLQEKKDSRPGRCPIGQVYLCISAGHLARPPPRVSGIPQQIRPKLTQGDMLRDSGGLEVEVLGAFGLLPFMDRMRATFNSSEGLQSVAAEMGSNVMSGLSFAKSMSGDHDVGTKDAAGSAAVRNRAIQGSITHPYVMVEVEGVRLRTRAAREGNTLNPCWLGQTMTFDVTEVTGQIRLSVWYEDPLYYTRGMRKSGASEGEDWLVAEASVPLRALAKQLFDGAAVRRGGSRHAGTSEVMNLRRVDDNTLEVVRWIKLFPPRPNGEAFHNVKNTLCEQSLGWVQVRIRLALRNTRTFCYMVPTLSRRHKAPQEMYYSFRNALTLALGLAGDAERLLNAVSGLLAPLRALEIVFRLVAGDARYLLFWFVVVAYVVFSDLWYTFIAYSPVIGCVFYLSCCKLYARFHSSLHIWSRGVDLSIDDVDVRLFSDIKRHRHKAVSNLLDKVPMRDLAKLHRGDIVELAISSPREFLLDVQEDYEDDYSDEEGQEATSRDDVVSAAMVWVPDDSAGADGPDDPHGRQWGARRTEALSLGKKTSSMGARPSAAQIRTAQGLESNPVEKLRYENRLKRSRRNATVGRKHEMSKKATFWLCCAPKFGTRKRANRDDDMLRLKQEDSDDETAVVPSPVKLDQHEARMARLRKSLNKTDKLSKALGKQEHDPVYKFWMLLLKYKAYINTISMLGEKLESLTNGADPYISVIFAMVWFLLCAAVNMSIRGILRVWTHTHGRYTFMILLFGGLYLTRLDELKRRARVKLINAIVVDIEHFEQEHTTYQRALQGMFNEETDTKKEERDRDSKKTMEEALDTSVGTWYVRRWTNVRRRVFSLVSLLSLGKVKPGKMKHETNSSSRANSPMPRAWRDIDLFGGTSSPRGDPYLASESFEGVDDPDNFVASVDEDSDIAREVIPLLGQVHRGPHEEIEALPDVSEEERLWRARREARGLEWGTPRLRKEDTEAYFWRVMQQTPLGKMYMRLPDRNQFIEEKISLSHILAEPPESNDVPIHPHDKRTIKGQLLAGDMDEEESRSMANILLDSDIE